MAAEPPGAENVPQNLGQEWDVIVVGTGMGGATIGHRLARAGRSVLFCELGNASAAALRGTYPEMVSRPRGSALDASHHADLLLAGRCADTLIDQSGPRHREFAPLIGSGAGGSSALYGMAMERFMPCDFEPGAQWATATDCSAVERWPISYNDLAPYYAEAESLYRVRGETDPLAAQRFGVAAPPALIAPPPISAAGAELSSFLAGRGLHPYQLPSACEYRPSCASCQGFLCPLDCKNDADRICLRPALRDHDAQMLANCRVTAVSIRQRRAVGIHCRWAGRDLELRARIVVLAAGALQSPPILLRSRDGNGHPGIGNLSGLVGRNLMRHLIDLYLVRPRIEPGQPFDNRRKELACNDFYISEREKLGTLQSFGRLPPGEMLFGSLAADLQASAWRWTSPALGLVRPVLTPVLRDISEGWITMATIIEDLPYAENAVIPDLEDPARAALRYHLRPEAARRVSRFRQHMKDVLQGRSWRHLRQAENNQRIAHVCGTSRFGDDPRTSVLDRDNRVHDVDNLFVVDSSFFPSSGGTNPSLTIAANALRVGERIAAHLL